jgi:hypothetical protein
VGISATAVRIPKEYPTLPTTNSKIRFLHLLVLQELRGEPLIAELSPERLAQLGGEILGRKYTSLELHLIADHLQEIINESMQ